MTGSTGSGPGSGHPEARTAAHDGRAPIAVALDAPDRATALAWAIAVAPHVPVLKVGLETYLRDGAGIVEALHEAVPTCGIFLDLKLHDIPNTVRGAARSVGHLVPEFLTVHASGGPAMVAAAVEALPGTAVTAVTVLTSLSAEDLDLIGLRGPAEEAVVRLATMAVAAGARAIVCSPHEVAAVRAAVADPDITLITPGVRPATGAGSALGDQARVATPERALADGADLLVIGRPITAAADPRAAAAALGRSLHGWARR
ncbi:MAG: orotidine-5'-phosphate decarboxylase [Candidatus Nanopelagicales bacterium]|jgi:orotidine-5'-phosphate decarboxylase|nr:orotidine-5'-phosphate decarboxylase [Candidatus Nanopelagicales bacterium]